MAYFYLYDNTNTLNLDDRVYEISFGGNKRNFDIVNFASADGGYLRGFGNFSPKKFKIVEREKRDSGDIHFWNSRRDDFIKMFTQPPYIQPYLYAVDGENTSTWRTPVVCEDIGDLSFKNYYVPDNTDITLTGYEGVWTSLTSNSSTLSITSNSEHSFTLTNNGTIECAPTFSFTPTGNEESFSVKIAEDFGFLLEGTFTAGVQISYNMSTGVLYIGGAMVSLSQYLSKGSHFKIPNGTNTVYVLCSGAGTFEYEFYERKI
jgi:hypothetical protein